MTGDEHRIEGSLPDAPAALTRSRSRKPVRKALLETRRSWRDLLVLGSEELWACGALTDAGRQLAEHFRQVEAAEEAGLPIETRKIDARTARNGVAALRKTIRWYDRSQGLWGNERLLLRATATETAELRRVELRPLPRNLVAGARLVPVRPIGWRREGHGSEVLFDRTRVACDGASYDIVCTRRGAGTPEWAVAEGDEGTRCLVEGAADGKARAVVPLCRLPWDLRK